MYEGKVVIGSLISKTWFSAVYAQVRMGWDLMITCISVSEKVKCFFFFLNINVHIHLAFFVIKTDTLLPLWGICVCVYI